MLVLNKDIHQYDKKENHEIKFHKVKECIKRSIYVLHEKLFEDTYKEVYEQSNIINDQLLLKNTRLKKKIVKLNNKIDELNEDLAKSNDKIQKLQKKVKKHGKK